MAMNHECENVNVKLLFFAKSREITGEKEVSLQLRKHLTPNDILHRIVELYPNLAVIQDTVVLAINQEYVADGDGPIELHPDDETVYKMSGKDIIRITPNCLCVEDATKSVTSPTSGAISVFIGTTRNNFEGKEVIRLEYEAYIPMAEKEIEKICEVIRKRWEVEHIAVFHRIGVVPVTEASVIIAVSSPHRQASLASVQYCIDTLKATVPIWKKEMYAEEGKAFWKENKECSWHKALPT